MKSINLLFSALTFWLSVIQAVSGVASASNTEIVQIVTNKPLVLGIGGDVFFARDGTTETVSMVSHTVSDSYQPLSDSSLYVGYGHAETCTPSKSQSKVDLMSAYSGLYGDRRSIFTARKLALKFTMQDYNQTAMESGWLAAGAPAGGVVMGSQFTPLMAIAPITGWLMIIEHDNEGVQILSAILRAEIECGPKVASEKGLQYELDAKILFRTLNKVTPGTWAASLS